MTHRDDDLANTDAAPEAYLSRMPCELPIPVGVDDRFTTGLLLDLDAVLDRYGYRPAIDTDFVSLARAIGGYLRRTGRTDDSQNEAPECGDFGTARGAA